MGEKQLTASLPCQERMVLDISRQRHAHGRAASRGSRQGAICPRFVPTALRPPMPATTDEFLFAQELADDIGDADWPDLAFQQSSVAVSAQLIAAAVLGSRHQEGARLASRLHEPRWAVHNNGSICQPASKAAAVLRLMVTAPRVMLAA